MQYQKKMCVLRQLKQGFSGDGRPLSGLIKVEQYGKNVAIEISAVGFAPLSSGEYYCLIADANERTELLPLRGKTLFNLVSSLDISGGFCGAICFVKTEVLPIAFGVNGNHTFDLAHLIRKAFLEVTKGLEQDPAPTVSKKHEEETAAAYDDEWIAEENYFEGEEDERGKVEKGSGHVHVESGNTGENEQTRIDSQTYANGENVLHAFTTDSDGFYQQIKGELDELFSRYPKDGTLNYAFPSSEWVRVKGSEEEPQELIGVVYEGGKAKYICYAVPAKDKSTPPKEFENAGFFIPLSPFRQNEGFFVLYQSAATGESIKPIED